MIAAVALILALILTEPVWGQERCMARDDMLSALREGYNESLVSTGTVDNRVVELTASPEGRTWTLLVTWPEGGSCILAAGKDWEVYPAVNKGRAS